MGVGRAAFPSRAPSISEILLLRRLTCHYWLIMSLLIFSTRAFADLLTPPSLPLEGLISEGRAIRGGGVFKQFASLVNNWINIILLDTSASNATFESLMRQNRPTLVFYQLRGFAVLCVRVFYHGKIN